MRQVFTALLLMLSAVAAYAQQSIIEVPVNAQGVICYEGAVPVDSALTKTDLYQRGREWFINTYVDAKETLQTDDQAGGKLVGKGVYRYEFIDGASVSDIRMRFVVNLDVQDGRCQYRIYNFSGDNSGQPGSGRPSASALNYNQVYRDYKAGRRSSYNGRIAAGLDKEVKEIVASLEQALRTPPARDGL